MSVDFSSKKIWAITFPVLIGMVMEHLLGMTDAIFMGRVGEVEFGASGLGSVYYLVLLVVGIGFGMGAQILMARRNGQAQYRAIGHVFFQGTMMLIIIAIVLAAFSYLLSPSILSNIISSDNVYSATLSYVRIRGFGLIFSFIAVMFRAYYVAITRTRILTVSSILMVVCNIALNYILVFGKLGFPALGIVGAAIGSVVSEAILTLFIVAYTRWGTDFRTYGMFRPTRLSWSIQRQIFGVSSWTMVQHFFSCGTWFFFFLAAESLGERTLAQSNLVRQIASLLYLFVAAFATTGSSLVSNLMGAGESEKVMGLLRRIIKICALATVPLLLFAVLFPSVLMRIYSDDMGLISSAIPSFLTMVSSYAFAIPAFVFFYAISGTGNTRAAMLIEFSVLTAYVCYVWATAYKFGADISVIWGAEVMYAVLMFTICLVYLRRAKWREKVI